MNNKQKNRGFSLTEVLIAVGILAVGMTFVAGVFPAGIYLTTIATERTIAAVAADEAFAKIRIFDVNAAGLVTNQQTPFASIDPNELEYPSTDTGDSAKQYCWSALCRRAGSDPNRLVQVTVFISRKISPNLKYHEPNGGEDGVRPMPVKVGVSGIVGDNELTITSEKTFINDGYTIVDNATGRIYRVLERYKDPDDDTILLDRRWEGGSSGSVWVVPPPVNGGRYPCIAVYQKVIRF